VRARRNRWSLIISALALIGLLAGPVEAQDEDDGDGPTEAHPAPGPCPGLEVVGEAGGDPMCTHGEDDLPPPPPPPPGGATPQATPGIACHGNGTSGQRVQAIYARASGTPDRYASSLAEILEHAAMVEDQFNDSAAATGQERHVRWVTDADCNLQVANVVLSSAAAEDFTQMISELDDRGFSRDDRKYLIWFDNTDRYCGIGTFQNHDIADPAANRSNQRRGYGRVDRDSGCWGYAEAHELMHNLGAVQRSAPNTTSAGHCRDEYDVMCYDDDGPGPVTVAVNPNCATKSVFDRLFDCNRNDYFNTAGPAPGSYLDTHWNTADSGWLSSSSAPAPPPPPNDEFSDPQALSGWSGSTTGSTNGYSKEEGEPTHAGNAGGASRWFAWTAPATGEAVFDTRGSGFDTLLAVYTGSSLGALTPVASDDDIEDGVDQDSEVRFAATAGTTYRIAIDGFEGASGTYALRWSVSVGDRLGFGHSPLTVNGTYRPLRGDFNGNGVDDVFWYAPGRRGDYVWFFGPSGAPTGRSYRVDGTYTPVAGDFNGNGVDDIFWYAAGSASDYLWTFNTALRATSRRFRVTGTYRPFAGDFDGDDVHDIFWYAPGTAADFVWFFNTAAGVRQTASPVVDGTFAPVAGDLDGNGRSDILWYGTGSNPDSIWLDFGGTGFVGFDVVIGGAYVPVSGRFGADARWDLVMYQPGTGSDQLWTARAP